MADQQSASPPPDPPEQGGREMPFLDHLEELRWRLLKSLTALLLGAVLCFVYSDALMQILIHPYKEAVRSLETSRPAGLVGWAQDVVERWAGRAQAPAPADTLAADAPLPRGRQLQALKPTTYLIISLQISLLGGLVLALPVVLYQLWCFVAPGLLPVEKRFVLPTILLTVFCFLLGAAVAYWVVLPVGLRFFLSLEPADMTSQWAVDEYISFVLWMILGFGVVFEMPVLALLLSRLGLLTAGYLRRIRSYAIVGIFVVAAVLTPSPDPLSQILMALPLLVLYEVSIWICRLSAPRR